jgi:IS5 family transposase
VNQQLTFANVEFTGMRKQTKRDALPCEDGTGRAADWLGRGDRAGLAEGVTRPTALGSRDDAPDPPDAAVARAVRSDDGRGPERDRPDTGQFAGLSLPDAVPDETTILTSRHRLEEHVQAKRLFEAISGHLADRNLFVRQGTIVEAAIIHAIDPTTNAGQCRDPESLAPGHEPTLHVAEQRGRMKAITGCKAPGPRDPVRAGAGQDPGKVRASNPGDQGAVRKPKAEVSGPDAGGHGAIRHAPVRHEPAAAAPPARLISDASQPNRPARPAVP